MIIKKIIGKHKNIKGKVAARINVAPPNINPENTKLYSGDSFLENFNKKYKAQLNTKRNIVSDNIWELIIINNGEKAANYPVKIEYFLLTKQAHL